MNRYSVIPLGNIRALGQLCVDSRRMPVGRHPSCRRRGWRRL